MTVDDVQAFGIPVNEWTDLDGIVSQMLFSNEGSIFTSKNNVKFYYDSDYELMYVRYYDKEMNIVGGGTLVASPIGRVHSIYDSSL